MRFFLISHLNNCTKNKIISNPLSLIKTAKNWSHCPHICGARSQVSDTGLWWFQKRDDLEHLNTIWASFFFFSFFFSKACLTLGNPMDCSTPGFSVLHHLLEFDQTHAHWVSDAIQLSHPLSPPSPLAFSLSRCQGLFQWINSLHQVTKVLELQLQH